jgi:hypothetical protein
VKTLRTSQNADFALRTLDSDDQLRIHTWFGRLRNWDEDEFVRTHCHSLKSMKGWYVFRTTSDFHIFFRFEGDAIVVEDIARTRTILAMSGGTA